MTVFLQVLGGVLAAITLIVIAGYFYLRYRFRKFLAQVEADEAGNEPLIVHLNEEISPEWLENPDARQACKDLEELGFARGSAFAIFELSAFQLISFARSPIIAAVYFNPAIGTWCDLVLDEKAGTEYTISNSPMGAGFDERPECKKIFHPQYSIGQLVAEADAIIAGNDENFVTHSNVEFRELFEEAYKKDMAWRCRKGGLTYNEFLASAAESGKEYEQQVLEQAFVQSKEDELYRWEQAALECYQKKEGLPDEEFWELEHKLVLVPFTSSALAFVNYLESKGFVNESQAEKVKKAFGREDDLFALFERLNGMLSPEIRAQFLADIDFPLSGKIYRLHESMVC